MSFNNTNFCTPTYLDNKQHRIQSKLLSLDISHISDICQMRLDFDNFDITETTAGVCTDSFAMTGPSGQNPLNLCGTLTGAHSEYQKLYFKRRGRIFQYCSSMG